MKEFITGIAREAGRLSLGYIGSIEVSLKSEKNIVTQADKAVENYIKGRIREMFPGHGIVAEESDAEEEEAENVWYIDPIDGTNNFAHADPNYCISIALWKNNIPEYGCIYIPMHDEMFYAEKGKGAWLNDRSIHVSDTRLMERSKIHVGLSPFRKDKSNSFDIFRHFMVTGDRARDYGFCAGELAYVASGRAEALIKLSQHPWDIAAGILLVKEAGGLVTDIDGKQFGLKNSGKNNMIASNGILHDEILTNLRKIRR